MAKPGKNDKEKAQEPEESAFDIASEGTNWDALTRRAELFEGADPENDESSGYQLYVADERTLSEILVDWQYNADPAIGEPDSVMFLKRLGLVGAISADQWMQILMGDMAIGPHLAHYLAQRVPNSICSDEKLVKIARYSRSGGRRSLDIDPPVADHKREPPLAQQKQSKITTFNPLPYISRPLVETVQSSFYLGLVRTMWQAHEEARKKKPDLPEFDQNRMVGTIAERVGVDPWTLQGFLPLAPNENITEIAAGIADFFATVDTRAAFVEQTENYLKSIKGIDLANALKHGVRKDVRDMLNLVRDNSNLGWRTIMQRAALNETHPVPRFREYRRQLMRYPNGFAKLFGWDGPTVDAVLDELYREHDVYWKDKDKTASTFGDYLRAKRNQKRLPQSSVSIDGTFSRQLTSAYENGMVCPSYDMLKKICLGLQLDEKEQLRAFDLAKKFKPRIFEDVAIDDSKVETDILANRLSQYLTWENKLYKFQKAALEGDILNSLQEGQKSGLIQRPTGTGKTLMFCSEAIAFNTPVGLKKPVWDKPVLILTPRYNLVDQIRDEFREHFGLSEDIVGTITGEPPMSDEAKAAALRRPILVTTFASYHLLLTQQKLFPYSYPIVMVDEAHLSNGKTWQRNIGRARNHAYVQGWSATDVIRNPGSRIETDISRALFSGQEKIHHTRIEEAVQNGEIVGADCYVYRTGLNQLQVEAKGKDYSDEEQQSIVNQPGRDAGIIEAFCDPKRNGGRFLPVKSSIWFCAGVKHAERVAKQLNERFYEGYAQVVTGGTRNRKDILGRYKGIKKDENGELDKEQFDRFGRPKLKALVNCDVLIEGMDAPNAEVCMMLRPTMSKRIAIQTAGRILRKDKNNPHKVGIVITAIDENLPEQIFFSLDHASHRLSPEAYLERAQGKRLSSYHTISREEFLAYLPKIRPARTEVEQVVPITYASTKYLSLQRDGPVAYMIPSKNRYGVRDIVRMAREAGCIGVTRKLVSNLFKRMAESQRERNEKYPNEDFTVNTPVFPKCPIAFRPDFQIDATDSVLKMTICGDSARHYVNEMIRYLQQRDNLQEQSYTSRDIIAELVKAGYAHKAVYDEITSFLGAIYIGFINKSAPSDKLRIANRKYNFNDCDIEFGPDFQIMRNPAEYVIYGKSAGMYVAKIVDYWKKRHPIIENAYGVADIVGELKKYGYDEKVASSISVLLKHLHTLRQENPDKDFTIGHLGRYVGCKISFGPDFQIMNRGSGPQGGFIIYGPAAERYVKEIVDYWREYKPLLENPHYVGDVMSRLESIGYEKTKGLRTAINRLFSVLCKKTQERDSQSDSQAIFTIKDYHRAYNDCDIEFGLDFQIKEDNIGYVIHGPAAEKYVNQIIAYWQQSRPLLLTSCEEETSKPPRKSDDNNAHQPGGGGGNPDPRNVKCVFEEPLITYQRRSRAGVMSA